MRSCSVQAYDPKRFRCHITLPNLTTSTGTAIAACNSDAHLRVYMQDIHGHIRESLYDDSWKNGTEKNVIASAKLGSPIAATSKDLNHVSDRRITDS